MKTKGAAYWICQSFGWGAYSVIGVLMTAKQIGWSAGLVVGYLLFFLYSIALTDLLRREIRRRQWLSASPGRIFLRLGLAAIAIATVQSILVVLVSVAFFQKLGAFAQAGALVALWSSVTVATSVWTIFYIAFTAPRRYREKEVSLQLALREAELRALEAQLNPHFLFNCLNSIRALVVENPVLCQDMLTRLASILRYNLHRDLNHTVPLASEVDVVADYLALEAVRFEDRLRVEFAIDPAASQIAVPPMLLQTLVENALKHGIAKLPAGGDVVIRASLQPGAMLIEVENTGQLNEPKLNQPKPGIGLTNTRERLRILYGGRASLHLESRAGGRVIATALIPRTA
jgi:anti-sigma regulatory factor (Ser/Thr protein kinase)